MAAADVAYLCDAANRYFRERVEPVDVIRTRVRRQHGDEPRKQARRARRRDDVRLRGAARRRC